MNENNDELIRVANCRLELKDNKLKGVIELDKSSDDSNMLIAWYLYKDGVRVETTPYKPDSTVIFSSPMDDGVYYLTVFLKCKDMKKSIKSPRFSLVNSELVIETINSQKGQKTSYSQQGEDLILKRILGRILKLPSRYKGLYVDVGCYHPSIGSNTKLLYDADWKGVNIDIQKESIDLMLEQRPRDVSLHVAVGDSFGEISGFINSQALSVTATCDASVAAKQVLKNTDIEEVKLKMVTLDWVMEQHNKDAARIDFLDLDVEGYELSVLKGLNFELYQPRVIAVEIHCPSIEDGIQSDVSKYLESKGYACIASSVITFFFVSKKDIPS